MAWRNSRNGAITKGRKAHGRDIDPSSSATAFPFGLWKKRHSFHKAVAIPLGHVDPAGGYHSESTCAEDPRAPSNHPCPSYLTCLPPQTTCGQQCKAAGIHEGLLHFQKCDLAAFFKHKIVLRNASCYVHSTQAELDNSQIRVYHEKASSTQKEYVLSHVSRIHYGELSVCFFKQTRASTDRTAVILVGSNLNGMW